MTIPTTCRNFAGKLATHLPLLLAVPLIFAARLRRRLFGPTLIGAGPCGAPLIARVHAPLHLDGRLTAIAVATAEFVTLVRARL